MKFSPAASWRILTWPGPGSPGSTSSHWRTSGPPVLWMRMAWGMPALQPVPAAKEKPRCRNDSGAPPMLCGRSDRGVGRQRREQQQRDDVGDLDHRVHGRTGGVLVGIADRVAGHRGLVGLRALAAVIAVLDIFLGIVPRAAAR